MKQFTLLLFILTSFMAFSQKVTIDEDTIKVDGKPYAIFEKSKGLGFDFTIKSMAGTELFFMQFLEFNNPSKVTSSNPKGRVAYFEITFFNDKQKCEMDGSLTKKAIAKFIVEKNLVVDGAVNQEAENKLVLINGMKFSEERKSLGGTTIIINN